MQSPLPFRPRPSSLEWVGGRYRLPAELRDGDAVIRPEVILWLELPSDLLVGSTLIHPRNPVSAADSLEAAMQRPDEGLARRPARIRVADETMAAELRASPGGIPVVVAAVPELDSAFEQLAMQMEQTMVEPSYLGDGDIPPDAVRELFQAASLLFRSAPWRHMSDQQVLRVDIPHFEIDGACLSVIGAGGDSFGLLLFDSILEYESFVLAAERGGPAEKDEDIDPDGIVSLRSLSFDRKKDLPRSMLAEIEQHRWPVAGAKAYPVLFCLDDAQIPLVTTEDDVRMMTACTRAFLAFFARHRELFAMDDPEPVTESSSGEDDVMVTLTAPYVVYEDEDEDDEWVEPPASRLQQVGRNDPCPCGSGKKYKKCHLDADQEPQRDAARAESIHEMDNRLVLAIARFADRTFGRDWAGLEVEADEALVQLMVPWVTWTATLGGKRVADAYLERNAGHLSEEEREWFDAQGRAWLSVFEITSVERGRVGVRDLLSGQERSVAEELGSESLVARDVILARILEFRGTPIFGGMYGRSLPPSVAAGVVDAVRAKLRLRKRDVPIERLQDFRIGLFLIEEWTDTIDAYDERRSTPPVLHNTDGDPLLFVTDSFQFDAANRAEIEKRLAALEGADIGETTAQESEIVFLRTSDDTVLGRVTVSAGVLHIETNSEKRADALRRRVSDACAGMLRDEKRDRQEAPSLSAAASTASSPPHVESPEEQAVVRQYKEKHYQKWLDMPLPALDGKTPRDAARSAKSRRELDLLLRDIENRENRLPEGTRFDVRRLRTELGLKD
ncbi:MAG TPA: SEC-C domain-containing protein [Thermoanaerobaculia bacterium]|nr:SEC-C domain-containing protein [Thermoanaerobaculia bacterium]